MIDRLSTYLSFVRFSHSVFALPFALTGALLASRQHPITWRHVVWIVVCMVTARSAAMGFNRLVDARFDAANPRTASRELPSGRMSSSEAAFFVAVMAIAFVAAAAQLSWLCFVLSPVALIMIFWYSLAKRYTWATQFFLGLAMAIAPVGGWIAAGGGAGWEPWLLGLAIALWVGGFDVLYACQDFEYDRKHGLRSIPARFGIKNALWISRLFHFQAFIVLLLLYLATGLSWVSLVGVIAVGALFVYQHTLVRAHDLSRMNAAFFTTNAFVSVILLATFGGAVFAAGI